MRLDDNLEMRKGSIENNDQIITAIKTLYKINS